MQLDIQLLPLVLHAAGLHGFSPHLADYQPTLPTLSHSHSLPHSLYPFNLQQRTRMYAAVGCDVSEGQLRRGLAMISLSTPVAMLLYS